MAPKKGSFHICGIDTTLTFGLLVEFFKLQQEDVPAEESKRLNFILIYLIT